jgi:putative PIN family toxin of toxin-antitoxin system
VDPVRAVIDPNVWISALISPSGAPADVLRAVLAEEVIAVATPHLLEELAAVLYRDKFRRWVSLPDAQAYVTALAGKVELRPEVGKSSRATRDPDDDYIVALAEKSRAVIVTGDDDLLSMDLNPPAITPRALLDRLRSNP